MHAHTEIERMRTLEEMSKHAHKKRLSSTFTHTTHHMHTQKLDANMTREEAVAGIYILYICMNAELV